jgi:hypothetical protein
MLVDVVPLGWAGMEWNRMNKKRINRRTSASK